MKSSEPAAIRIIKAGDVNPPQQHRRRRRRISRILTSLYEIVAVRSNVLKNMLMLDNEAKGEWIYIRMYTFSIWIC